MTYVAIARNGKEERYLVYPSGVMVPADVNSTKSLPRQAPGASTFNRMVAYNNQIRKILGIKAADIPAVEPL